MTQEEQATPLMAYLQIKNLEARLRGLESEVSRLKGNATVDGSLVRGRIDAQTGFFHELQISPSGKLYFGEAASDYLTDSLLHFETGSTTTSNIEFTNAASSFEGLIQSYADTGASLEIRSQPNTGSTHYARVQTIVVNALTQAIIDLDAKSAVTGTNSARIYLSADSNDTGYIKFFSAGTTTSRLELIDSTFALNQTWLRLTEASEVTIASGAITVTRTANVVDTESDAASDNLDTITGTNAVEGCVLKLRSAADARDVVVKHNTGNIKLAGGADCTLGVTTDRLILEYDGSNWVEWSRSLA